LTAQRKYKSEGIFGTSVELVALAVAVAQYKDALNY